MAATDCSDAAGTLWLDVAGRDWSDDLLDATGLTRAQMPRLVEGSAPSGDLLPALAELGPELIEEPLADPRELVALRSPIPVALDESLGQLPVDVLKIDRSFVHHMLDDAQDRAIVEGVIGLARTFQCAVVAEGVESPAQARTLLELGCDIGQGTGIAAPMPAAAVSGWIRDYRGLFSLAPAGNAGTRIAS